MLALLLMTLRSECNRNVCVLLAPWMSSNTAVAAYLLTKECWSTGAGGGCWLRRREKCSLSKQNKLKSGSACACTHAKVRNTMIIVRRTSDDQRGLPLLISMIDSTSSGIILSECSVLFSILETSRNAPSHLGTLTIGSLLFLVYL